MRGWIVVVIAGALMVLGLCAPAALAFGVTGMSPSIGEGGATLTCAVTGSFRASDAATTASAPQFMLTNFYQTIRGTTLGWDTSAASVTFSLPLNADQGMYTLQVSQDYRTGQDPIATDTKTLPNAFRLYWVPGITSISPTSVVAGISDWTIFVNGDRFLDEGLYKPHSIVRYNGTDLLTTYRSKTQLSAVIPAAFLGTPGMATITVFNSSGTPLGAYTGASSGPVTFTITGAAPVVTSIDPSSAKAGSAGFDLVVVGHDFLTGSGGAEVLWNGKPLVTTRESTIRLTAAVPATLLSAPGVATVAVRNGVDGAASNSKPFTIGNPVPTLTAVTPSVLWAGSVATDIVLAATGTSFIDGARIVMNGAEKPGTTFVDTTRLTLPLTPADMASVGTIAVTVKNPPFPPGLTAAGSIDVPVKADTTEPAVTIDGADDEWHRKPVKLTFTATDAQSGVQKVQFTAPPAVGGWTLAGTYTVPVADQGSIPVTVQAFDWCNHIGTAQATVKIDATKPGTQTLGNATVKRGRTAVLKYRVTEPSGLSPKAAVVITVKDRGGAVVSTLTEQSVPVNVAQAASFTCTLGKGTYAWYVNATDLAGNRQKNVAQAKLTVK